MWSILGYILGVVLAGSVSASDNDTCTQIESGWVCGVVKDAVGGVQYISYKGIPYAKQPLGELRFKELQPAEAWDDYLYAYEEGPVCPQYDEVYGSMVNPKKGMSESCINANVHVPIVEGNSSLPIFVFVHGGGFQAGSGDSDVHGPEYLVSKEMIVVTFNYRINVFGFFSMNNEQFPGNNGLRDIRTLLNWVQTNAAAFGGNPEDVTLAGQSAGAACAHLISLSNATTGMFKRMIIMSGTGIPAFFSSSSSYANLVANKFLEKLDINSTDPDYIHSQLISLPLETIMKANRIVQSETGLVSFVPNVEGSYPNFTTILDDDPINLIKQGRGNDTPLIIGFTAKESEFFRSRLRYRNIVDSINQDISAILSTRLRESVSQSLAQELGQRVVERYFNGTVTLEGYVRYCTDTLFIYPAFKLAQWRSQIGGAPVYLYQYSFDSTHNIVKSSLGLNYKGGGAHIEDLTMIFRSTMFDYNTVFPPKSRDDLMKYSMTEFIANFMKCDNPFCDDSSAWPQVNSSLLNYQSLRDPITFDTNIPATDSQRSMIEFFDDIEITARNLTTF